jgi:NAD-dependent SIR2 family protein deacetylase
LAPNRSDGDYATAEEAVRILDPDGRHKVVLWVGAGLSVGAGYPSTKALLEALKKDTGDRLDITGEFTQVVDRFVQTQGWHALSTVLAGLFSAPRQPTPTLAAIARLAKRACFAAIVTTNYDRLLENALESEGVHYLSQVLDRNENVVLDGPVRLIKVHGSQEDWQNVILSGKSYEAFDRQYQRLFHQMDALLRARRLVLAGCSLQDPRLIYGRRLGACHPPGGRPPRRSDSERRAVPRRGDRTARGRSQDARRDRAGRRRRA